MHKLLRIIGAYILKRTFSVWWDALDRGSQVFRTGQKVAGSIPVVGKWFFLKKYPLKCTWSVTLLRNLCRKCELFNVLIVSWANVAAVPRSWRPLKSSRLPWARAGLSCSRGRTWRWCTRPRRPTSGHLRDVFPASGRGGWIAERDWARCDT